MKRRLKIVLSILLSPLYVYSEGNLIQFLLEKETMLHIRNVDSNDFLNLREKATSNSKIVTRVPYNAITLNRRVEKENKDKKWLKVEFYNTLENKNYKGWVHKHYIKEKAVWGKRKTNDIVVNYPLFLTISVKKNIIYLIHDVEFKYEQYLDGRYGVIPFKNKRDFYMTIQVYDRLDKALKEHCLEEDDLIEREHERGYRIRTGVEGIGVVYNIVEKDKKIFLLALDYNINPITSLQKYEPFILRTEESLDLQDLIMSKIRVKKKPEGGL